MSPRRVISVKRKSAQWNKATNPFNIDEMKKLHRGVSSRQVAEEARQILVDEGTIDGIEKNGVGEAFVSYQKCLWPWR